MPQHTVRVETTTQVHADADSACSEMALTMTTAEKIYAVCRATSATLALEAETELPIRARKLSLPENIVVSTPLVESQSSTEKAGVGQFVREHS
jgi:hypothetical protein